MGRMIHFNMSSSLWSCLQPTATRMTHPCVSTHTPSKPSKPSPLFPHWTPTIFSSCADFKTVNLWCSTVRGTRGQPVILNTSGLAAPHHIWTTLLVSPPPLMGETIQVFVGAVRGQWLDSYGAVLLVDQSQSNTGIKLQATRPTFPSNWIKLFSFLRLLTSIPTSPSP